MGLPADVRVERREAGREVKWVVFRAGARAAQGKLVAQLAAAEPAAGARQGFIKAVSVRPKLRGMDVAAALLEMCKAFMRDDLGYYEVLLEAEEDMARFGKLVGLYERAGFEVVETGAAFKMLYNGDETFRVVPMRCVLRRDPRADLATFSIEHAVAQVEAARAATGCVLSVWEALERTGGIARAAARMRAAQANGHPDWVQFLVLVQHLGAAFAKETGPALADLWVTNRPVSVTQASEAGCAADALQVLGEIEAPSLATPQPARVFGLDSLQPVWNPDEYLHTILLKNGCILPRVGLQMLRFRRLDKLLQAEVYADLLNAADMASLAWVHRFAQLWDGAVQPAADAIAQDGALSDVDLARAKVLVNKFAPSPWTW